MQRYTRGEQRVIENQCVITCLRRVVHSVLHYSLQVLMKTDLNCKLHMEYVSDLSCIHLLCSFHADPSGTFMKYQAKAIGSGSEGAQTELQKEYHKSMTLKEAETLALTVLKSVMEEKLNKTNVQIAAVTPEHNFRIYSEEELQGVIDRL